MDKKQGFHLFELLIVLVIVGILTTLSIPLYSHYMAKSHRLEAMIALKKLAASLEIYFSENNTYQGATLENLNFSPFVAKDSYQLSILENLNDTYTLLATPLGDQAEKDMLCGTLTLNSLGEIKVEGTGQISDCFYPL